MVYYGGKGIVLRVSEDSHINRIELKSEAFEKGHRHCLGWKQLQYFKVSCHKAQKAINYNTLGPVDTSSYLDC